MFKIIKVTDTREFKNDKPISGTGKMHRCERCKKYHKIWVYIKNEDNPEELVVGQGCAKRIVEEADIQEKSSEESLEKIFSSLKKVY